jgi:hypothetical protein
LLLGHMPSPHHKPERSSSLDFFVEKIGRMTTCYTKASKKNGAHDHHSGEYVWRVHFERARSGNYWTDFEGFACSRLLNLVPGYGD